MHFSSGCQIMWKYTKVINITIVKMMKQPWAHFSAGPVTVSKQILQLLFLIHCLCLSNNVNSYKISAVHLDAAFNNWLWRQVCMMSLNQVYVLIAFFFLPMCVSRWSKLQLQERVSPAPPHPNTPTSPTRRSRGSSEPWTWNRGLPFTHVYIREPVRRCYWLIQTLLHTLFF